MGGAAHTNYDTRLSPEQEKGYQAWKAKVAPKDSGQDFDWKGAYLADLKPDSRGHYYDTYKKPNHPTFSTGSVYSTPEHMGGVWSRNPEGKDTYTPSEWMMKDKNRIDSLKQYMAKAEPNAILIMGSSPTNIPKTYTPQQEEAAYARLEKQGMSDQGIVAPEQIIPAVKGFAKDLKEGIQKKLGPAQAPTPSGTPNAYNRDTSKSMHDIEIGLLDAENQKPIFPKNPYQKQVDESKKRAEMRDFLQSLPE
jgi:hypothetical protein